MGDWVGQNVGVNVCVLAPVWKSYMAETSKRKTWKSSSTSSIEDGLFPDDKKIRCNPSLTDSEADSEPDEVISLLNMAEAVMQGSILPVTIPPRAHPRGFAIFFLLGGLFPTPGHAERDNSPPPGLLIDHKYVVSCSKLISVQ